MKKLTVKKILFPIGIVIAIFLFTSKISFHPLPKKKLPLFPIAIEESYNNDEYQLTLKNPIDCPIRFFLSCEDKEVNEILNEESPLILAARADSIISIKDKGHLKGKIKLKIKLGDPSLPIQSNNLKGLPYPKGKRYKLLQGNNSNPTHNSFISRYAFDFTMKIGDTISSTQNGYVIGVIDGYKGWGASDKWKSYGNQVIIYDPIAHLFTLYGHLKQDGSLVEVGDYVKVGQPIAISGKTGQTTEEHLHFNTFKASSEKSGLKSYPLDSIGKYKVKELKRYQWMTD